MACSYKAVRAPILSSRVGHTRSGRGQKSYCSMRTRQTSLLNLTQMIDEAVSISALMGWNTEGWSQFSHISDLSDQYGHNVYRTVPILEILLRFRRSLATDPRDKLFALYGLIENDLPPGMTFS